MPKSKKPAMELTKEELARRVFPKKVVEEAKKLALSGGRKTAHNSS